MKHSRQSQRRIDRSGPGHIAFRPGKEHPLDIQVEQARQAKEQLNEQVALFAESLHALAPLEEMPARMEAEDEAMRHFLAERYQDYFHQDHIESTFLWLRRRRAVARLQAAQAALSLVQELLAADPLIDQLQDLVRSAEDIEVD